MPYHDGQLSHSNCTVTCAIPKCPRAQRRFRATRRRFAEAPVVEHHVRAKARASRCRSTTRGDRARRYAGFRFQRAMKRPRRRLPARFRARTSVASRMRRKTPSTIIAATKSDSSGSIHDVCQRDRNAAHDDGDGAERVTSDVKERGANVEVALPWPRSDHADEDIDRRGRPLRRSSSTVHRAAPARRSVEPLRTRSRSSQASGSFR